MCLFTEVTYRRKHMCAAHRDHRGGGTKRWPTHNPEWGSESLLSSPCSLVYTPKGYPKPAILPFDIPLCTVVTSVLNETIRTLLSCTLILFGL
ncbi:hypothetical protein AAFF_G00100390 [Aldrovandia affinis]|uniref:Uncharacterized protein n=1 Tax=Aldrovandia affinis TaxID=143900 RepID=A0AAD7WCB0_9TELE|nr:hypothetical protein AAFF_G00100390 [Aldrovandia affinis]